MKQMQNSAPQAVSKLPGSWSLAASSRLGTMLATAGLCLALTLPGMARNEFDGTGAVEANGTLFTNATNGQGFYVDASVETDWWVMGKNPQDIAASGATGKDVMTHIDETLGAGDSFWMGFTFEYPQSPYGGGKKKRLG